MRRPHKLRLAAIALASWQICFEGFANCNPAAAFDGTFTYDNTTVDDGTGNLLIQGDNTAYILNSSHSVLTGSMNTVSEGGSYVTLTDGSVWNLTANSSIDSLINNSSSVIFSSPTDGTFKTLTLGQYSGSGGTITFNATLGGSGSGSDKMILNSLPQGTTGIRIVNFGGTGAQTTGAGIPLILVEISRRLPPGAVPLASGAAPLPANAFTLTGPPILVGGYLYTLQATANQYALFSQTATTTDQAIDSAVRVLQSRQSQTITGLQLGSILLGANEQINCLNCATAFASVGSFALGDHGRWGVTDRLTLLAGASYDEFSGAGYNVQSAPIVAVSLRYDLVDWGNTRPFFEAGSIVAPYEAATFSRSYADGSKTRSGSGSEIDREGSVFGRAGWVMRPTPRDELAAFGELDRSWQYSGGYSEALSVGNPFPASVPSSVDTMDIAKIGVQYTHLFNGNIEANVNARFAQAFAANYTINESIYGFDALNATTPNTYNWGEFGASVGYRLSHRLTLNAFALGTVGAEPAGRHLHGGLGLRYSF